MIVGLGVDIVEVSRIRAAIAQYGKRFLRRIFTKEELCYAQSRPRTIYQHLAARFAAKEAFLKAIGTGWGTKQSPQWKEIEVVTEFTKKSNLPSSQKIFLVNNLPMLNLSGKAQKVCQELRIRRTHLSLAHTVQYAVAVVILEG